MGMHCIAILKLSFLFQACGLLVKVIGLPWVFLGWSAQAATGPEVAQLLNNRYRNTPQECPGNHASYFCSGVLVSGLSAGSTLKFWEHNASDIATGARGFSYLRRDLGIRTLALKSGMIFVDPFTAISQGKTVDVRCAYPLAASIQGLYGCGVGGTEDDPGSCATLGVDDATGWLAHFQQQGQQPGAQCSLSSRVAAQFRASLLAHEQLGGNWVTQPNQLQIRNWDALAPAQMPVQGLFYDINQRGGLRVAQEHQGSYYAATGQWLPILRLDMTQAEGLIFGFDLQEQLYVGYQAAERLNARYFDTALTCPDGRASFYCNGVVLRGVYATTDYHAWNPSDSSIGINGVSTSYLRADARITKPVWPQGFLFKAWAAPAAYPLTLRCAYPIDAGTALPNDACTFSGVCEQEGVTSVQAWLAKYAHFAYRICSFTTAPEQIQLSLDIRAHLDQVAWHEFQDWNEFMVAAWPQNIPELLPIEALFYSPAYYGGDGLAGARYVQHDYFTQTGRFLPVVQLRLDAANGQIFSFRPDDQCLTDSCSPPQQALDAEGHSAWFKRHGR